MYKDNARTGITIGCCAAMILSYTQNESIIWMFIHGILSWFYVIFRLFV